MSLSTLVFVEVALSFERDSAGGAGIRPLPGVAAEMLLQHTGLHTVPSTVRTYMFSCGLGSGCRSSREQTQSRLTLQSSSNMECEKGKCLLGVKRRHGHMQWLSGSCRRHCLDVNRRQWSMEVHPSLSLLCDCADVH